MIEDMTDYSNPLCSAKARSLSDAQQRALVELDKVGFVKLAYGYSPGHDAMVMYAAPSPTTDLMWHLSEVERLGEEAFVASALGMRERALNRSLT